MLVPYKLYLFLIWPFPTNSPLWSILLLKFEIEPPSENFVSLKNEIIFSLSVNYFLGDLNNDTIINILDIIILVEHILNSEISDLDNADINGDGNVNILDVVQLVNIILN